MFPRLKQNFDSQDTEIIHFPQITNHHRKSARQYHYNHQTYTPIAKHISSATPIIIAQKIKGQNYKFYQVSSLPKNKSGIQKSIHALEILPIQNKIKPHHKIPKWEKQKKYKSKKYIERNKSKYHIPKSTQQNNCIQCIMENYNHNKNKQKAHTLRLIQVDNQGQEYLIRDPTQPKKKSSKRIYKIISRQLIDQHKTQPEQIPFETQPIQLNGKLYAIVDDQQHHPKQSNPRFNDRAKSNIQLQQQARQKWQKQHYEKQKWRQSLNKQVAQFIKFDTVFYLKKTGKYKNDSYEQYHYVIKKNKSQISQPSQAPNQQSQQSKPKTLQSIDINIQPKQQNSLIESPAQQKKYAYVIKFPSIQTIQQMIDKYQPLTSQLNVEQLKKSKQYYRQYSDKADNQYLYFGGWNHQKKQRHGFGVFVTKHFIVQGVWKSGYLTKGAQLKNQSIYKGTFKNNRKHGEGECTWLNGQTYLGEWENGLRQGHGFWKSKNGSQTYSGQWLKGKVSGYGEYSKKNQSIYKGYFLNFVKVGSGIQTFINGDKYEGAYENGEPHGKGKYTWKCGLKYEGEFKNSQRVGRGQLTKQQSFQLNGQFACQRPHGMCQLKLSNGDLFQGKFVYGTKYGLGTLQHGGTGKQQSGFWNQNSLKQRPFHQRYHYKSQSTF